MTTALNYDLNTDQINVSDKQRLLEIIAVAITGAGKFILIDVLDQRFPFILAAMLFWISYIWIRSRRINGMLKYWGFRLENFSKVWRMVLPFGIISLLAFTCIGIFRGTVNLTWHIIPILIIYPIWGTIQQFLVIGLVAGNLQHLKAFAINRIVIILLTATLFGLLHYPYPWLMLGTFLLAIFYGLIYLKSRNLYVLGLFHGWLGGLFFYTLVDRDPFLEVFGKYLNL